MTTPMMTPEPPRHNSLRALLDRPIRVEQEDLRVSDVWIDPATMALRYAGLDVGGWLDRHVALVPADRLRWAEGALGWGWRAQVTRREIEAPEARLDGRGGLLDLAALPPVVTGPFGHTISPLMIGAGLMAGAEEERPPRDPSREGEAEDDRLSGALARRRARLCDRSGDWLGAPIAARHDVMGQGSQVGPVVADLLIEAQAMRITHVVIEAAGRVRAVPVEALEPRGARGGEAGDGPGPVALRLTRAEIDALPEVVGPRDARARGTP